MAKITLNAVTLPKFEAINGKSCCRERRW